jgi:hypothetical protein
VQHAQVDNGVIAKSRMSGEFVGANDNIDTLATTQVRDTLALSVQICVRDNTHATSSTVGGSTARWCVP